MGQVLYDEYGDRKAKGGGLLRDAVGRNNPQLYNPNMTVAEVRTSYETKMRGAMTATSSFISDGGAPDDVARAAFSKMTGIDVQQLGAADLASVTDLAAKQLGSAKKGEIRDQLAMDILGGVTRMQPFNAEHKKAVDTFVTQQMPQVADMIVKGDDGAFSAIGSFVREHNYLPQNWNSALRELVMNGDAKNPAKQRAYALLAAIAKDNPTAYEASSFDKDMKERVAAFGRIVERTNDPVQATQFIATNFDLDHKESVQSLKAIVDNPSTQHPGEVQQLKLTDITDVFKKNNGFWRAPTDPTNEGQERLMMHAYQETYKDYRYAGKPPDLAKELAIAAVTKSWGPSTAFVGATAPARFMQNPPDNFYKQPILGMKPFEDQAREVISQELARRYPEDAKANAIQKGSDRLLGRRNDITTGLSKYDASNVEVYILPSVANGAKTNDEVRSGNPAPHYQVAYRDPRTGNITIADEAWQPNLARMRDEATEAQNSEITSAAERRKAGLDSKHPLSTSQRSSYPQP